MSFNLIDNQWILVRDQKDNVKEVSLKECLLNCENFLELAGETAAQDAALLRLLIAMNLTVMYRWDKNGEQSLLETEDQALDRWQAVWESGHLQKRAITEYLESVKDSFELDGDGKRFLQSENAKIGTSYKSSKLMGDLSESNNKLRLFQLQNGEAKEELSLACSARWLLNLNGFDDTSSKSSTKYKLLPKEERLSPGAGWLGKIGLVFVKGQNLFETIMLNTILLPEQFIKTDKWPETPLKNVFPAILLFTKQVSVNRSSFLYNVIRTNNQERILSNDTHPEQQYGRFYS